MTSIVVGTAGHIDHGKSTLVQALTGTDPDRLKEEKARGITIDLGFAHAVIGGVQVAFVDVPGHERFVRNMLAGVGGIDGVLLVVAADESVMPQTREHFAICRLLQVPAGVVALTKADLVDADTLALADLEVRELLAGSSLEGAGIVPVSAKTGQGLDALRDAIAQLAAVPRTRSSDGPPRLPIDRVFSMRGFGTVVTGTLQAGAIALDQDLTLLPGGRAVKVRGLQVHGAAQSRASAGRRVAVNLGGIEVADVARGDTLTAPGAFETTRRVDAAIDLLPDARPLKHGARVRFHHGTSEVMGRVALAAERPPRAEGPASVLEPGHAAFARIRLEAPAVLTRGDRFILRAYSPTVTIGGGRVLDPLPPRGAIRTAAGVRRFQRLDGGDEEAAMAMIEERGARGWPASAFAARLGMTPRTADAMVERLNGSGRTVVADGQVFAAGVVTTLQQQLVAAVEAHHRSSPLSEGMPREEARERIFGRAFPGLFDVVVLRLAGEGTIAGRERLARSGHAVSLSPEEARAAMAIAKVFQDAGLAPPDVPAAATAARVPAAVAERMVTLLLRRKTLVKVDTLRFHQDALQSLKAEIVRLKGAGLVRLDVATFKDRFGVSRKYAIPLLEWLDRERVTRRVGDTRVVL
ncbi:MAG TPA: selenocysteine-specific translation elongation factor [Vicinamibacterales bacterium]|nr:selenocysteine-specific translation elongation factor [Vicinamibacterales bacterium]